MAQFTESFLQELADRNDIVDVVSAYVRLTKRSGANLFGLCPFHSEKTPSFSVSPEKQIYHCFGCGKGGSVFNFIMEIENLTFPESVAFLARRAGVDLPAADDGDSERRDRRERLLALNREAARFFHETLRSPAGKPGQDYIARRGITAATATSFGLGYAPDSFYALTDAMHAKGFADFELVDAGLANPNRSGKGVHDVFRDRLMFPVIDVRGSVIAFSGRILGDGEPKYLNSRETPVFSKSRHLFALNLAKKSKNGYILLTEGNIDVVSLHQAGFDSAVASLGTSLTPDQARLISRFAKEKEVVIAYDNDGAGQKAAQRAIGILQPLDLRVRVLRMEGAKDPDEFIRANGRDAFANLLERSESDTDYRLRNIAQGKDLTVDEGRIAYLREAVELLATLPDAMKREIYGMRVADTVGVGKDPVLSEIARVRKLKLNSAQRKEERDALRETQAAAQPHGRGRSYADPKSAAAEERIVRLLLRDPSLADGLTLTPEDFTSPMLGRLYGIQLQRAAAHEPFTLASISEEFSTDEMADISRLLQEDAGGDRRKALDDCLAVIRAQKLAAAALTDQGLLEYFQFRKEETKKGMGDKNG